MRAMIISFKQAGTLMRKRDKKPVVGRFRVIASDQGVCFYIDHQGFNIITSAEEHKTKKNKLKINKWYAKQLRKALKRLKGSK